MDADSIANLIYLGILLTVLGGGFLAARRLKVSQLVQGAAVWVFIFVGAIIVAGLWGDLRNTVAPRQAVFQSAGETRISAPRAPDGHYYFTLEINDVPVEFVVDTGATDLVLTRQDAARVGLDLDSLAFLGIASTANGQTRTATVRLDKVQLGPLVEQDVRAVVNGGEMFGSLLGMAYLQHFGRIEIEGNRLTLIP